MKKPLLIGVLALVWNTCHLMAQTFTGTYSFANVSSSSGTTDPTPVPIVTGVTFSSFTAHGLGTGPEASGRFAFRNWSLGGSDIPMSGQLDAEDYFEVTLAPKAGYTLTLSSISFTIQRSSTGPRQYAVRSSLDNYASNLPASLNQGNTDLSIVAENIFEIRDDASTSAKNGSKITLNTSFQNLGSAVTFRFYAFNAKTSLGTFSLNKVDFSGTVTDVAPTFASGYPKLSSAAETSLTLASKINEAGKTYLVALPDNAAPPSAAQVKAGHNAGDLAATSAIINNVNNETEFSTQLTGLIPETDYDIYFVAEDANGNLQATATKIDASTLPQVLPVKLHSFDAIVKGGLVEIKWTTSWETNNQEFIIERTTDGENFSVAGRIAGAGNSASAKTYSITDRQPFAGTSYYRLQQVDFSGKTSYSPLVPVRILQTVEGIAVYPNPFTSSLTVQLNTSDAEIDAEIVALNGARVRKAHGNLSKINESFKDLSSLPSGEYIVKVTTKSRNYQTKIIRE